jgi:hypothetical protein
LRPTSLSTMTPTILLADKKLRTKTLYWTALLVVLGVLGFWSLAAYLDALTALQTTDPQLVAEKYGSVASFQLRNLPLCFSIDDEVMEGRYD